MTLNPAEVSAAFSLPGRRPALIGEVARGFQGLVHRLDTTAGSWAIKQALAPLDLARVERAADFEDAASRAGVPLPQPVRAADGQAVAVVGGVELRCHRWVALDDLDTGLGPVELGSLLAGMHRIPFDYPESADAWYFEPVGAARWDELVGQLRDRAPFGPALAQAHDRLVAVEQLVEAPEIFQTCHRDLFADNVRRADGRLVVIDWENCGEADPSMELGMVLFEYTRTDPARTAALYHAYRDAGGPGKVAGPGSFSMAIAVVHHIGELGCRRWAEADQAGDDRARRLNEGRVNEFLSDMLTADLATRLVDACR